MDGNNYTNGSGQDNYYQNLYNMFGGRNLIADKEAKSIRRFGMLAGATYIASIVMQYIISFFIIRSPFNDLYFEDAVFQNGFGVIFQIMHVFIPFMTLYLLYGEKERPQLSCFSKPKSNKLFILAIFVGLMVCNISDTASSFLLAFCSVFGVDFNSGMEDIPMPSDAVGVILMIIGTAVVPALIEEFAFRFVILQPLRKHGDKFAILMSSFFFAILHGNMVQIPFAFLVGIVLGYICIATGSIWASVAVHFLNNLSAVIFSLFYDKYPDASVFPYYLITFAFTVLGVIALIVFKGMTRFKLRKQHSELSKKVKNGLYFCSPTFVFAIIYTIYSSFTYQDTTSSIGGFFLFVILIGVTIIILKRIKLIQNEPKITPHSSYNAARVLMIISAVLGTLMIIGNSVADSVVR